MVEVQRWAGRGGGSRGGCVGVKGWVSRSGGGPGVDG